MITGMNMLQNRSMPEASIIPELACGDVDAAAAWLSAAFEFSVRLRIAGHRVQMTFGNGAIVLVNAEPSELPVMRQRIMVRVENVDEHHRNARALGAEILSPPASYPYGERQYSCRDPEGHTWIFSQSIADIDPDSWNRG